MSRRPDPEKLNEIMVVAEKWLYRCNGKPDEGVLENAAGLRAVLASSSDVGVYPDGVITWTGPAGKFTAEPVRDELVELDVPSA